MSDDAPTIREYLEAHPLSPRGTLLELCGRHGIDLDSHRAGPSASTKLISTST